MSVSIWPLETWGEVNGLTRRSWLMQHLQHNHARLIGHCTASFYRLTVEIHVMRRYHPCRIDHEIDTINPNRTDELETHQLCHVTLLKPTHSVNDDHFRRNISCQTTYLDG